MNVSSFETNQELRQSVQAKRLRALFSYHHPLRCFRTNQTHRLPRIPRRHLQRSRLPRHRSCQPHRLSHLSPFRLRLPLRRLHHRQALLRRRPHRRRVRLLRRLRRRQAPLRNQPHRRQDLLPRQPRFLLYRLRSPLSAVRNRPLPSRRFSPFPRRSLQFCFLFGLSGHFF